MSEDQENEKHFELISDLEIRIECLKDIVNQYEENANQSPAAKQEVI
jgi:hypothetical protein